MSDIVVCPFCQATVAKSSCSVHTSHISCLGPTPRASTTEGAFSIQILSCPACKRISSIAIGTGPDTSGICTPLFPQSFAIIFPEYIPQAIRADYEEAAGILQLSPKASATLSRRYLQGMIRDFWGVRCSTLFQEINALQGKIPSSHWKAMDALRRIGNIGAHMEKDVNCILDITPEEAEKLLRLIEFLLKNWYVERYESDQLLAHINAIAGNLDSQRQQGHPPTADPRPDSNTESPTGQGLPPYRPHD